MGGLWKNGLFALGRGAWRGETKLNETEDAGSVGRSRSEEGMATTKVPVALFRSDRRVWGTESSETEIIVVLSATWKKQKKRVAPPFL